MSMSFWTINGLHSNAAPSLSPRFPNPGRGRNYHLNIKDFDAAIGTIGELTQQSFNRISVFPQAERSSRDTPVFKTSFLSS
jgi:hypothetical protein